MNRTRAQIAMEVLIFLLLLGGIAYLVRGGAYCSYEKSVRLQTSETPREARAEMHRYALETVWTDEEDVFRLIRIAGWEADLADGAESGEPGMYEPGTRGILLRSDGALYRVDTFREERTDIPAIRREQPSGAGTELGFFAYFPEASVETGVYEIGLLVREGGEECVLWTGRDVAIP